MSADGEVLLSVTIPIQPRAKGRPRVLKSGGVYTPHVKREEDLALLMRSAWGGKDPIDYPVSVEIDLGKGWCGLTIRALPEHKKILRGDLDNYAKTILDAAEKATVLENDRYVRQLHIYEVDADWEDPE